VLTAALTLADREGLDAVTMRAVAARLGVEAMSLYKHVRNKEALLDGLVERVMAEMTLPPTHLGWREGLRQRCHGMRAVLLRHRWASGLVESRITPAPARLRHHDATLGLVRAAGFSTETAFVAILSLDSFVYGFVAQEVWWPFAPEERPEVIQALAPEVDPAAYPHLVEMMSFVYGRTADADLDFDFGLALVLDGLERALTR
jgi:AcrR family transcriptional regulator